uniref:Uncharacterized protein n=1 Tax=Acrobeloides nanus TaxID=290746 RepID=A0A914DBS6_9BILA
MAILLEQGWKLPEEGHSKLFVQANHPDIIDEFVNLAKNIMKDNQIILNLVTRVTMDMYQIIPSINNFKPQKQKKNECYAHAVATVMHLSMRRIECREGGVPPFETLKNQLTELYGLNGANTKKVLEECCPSYRLRSKEINEQEARKAINERRPVVVTFALSEEQWEDFEKFYESNPKGTLTKDNLRSDYVSNKKGHAVVLMKCEPDCLILMNSGSKEFANEGFFKIAKAEVLNSIKCYDVYWEESDLKPSEKKAYEKRIQKDGVKTAQKVPEGIKNLPYICPVCQEESPASDFIGHFMEAICPKCRNKFKPLILGFKLFS